ncbi:sugar phosphate/phosphate translocator-like protein [Dunaliella salina]|uniref:Sugar phosphate/phosphate translocator-like protein n=1 Tax=Dunaliella salina TaxID=3046 RepID=A0ABQ7H1M5_DUNSA|nr:sugar phosphate/phosphate translocator-like protein [Dunaliella salina]|eukprot:KAF5840710.1 sugar phosphate/phosphate translocator-like protein [Dunaliella salina]
MHLRIDTSSSLMPGNTTPLSRLDSNRRSICPPAKHQRVGPLTQKPLLQAPNSALSAHSSSLYRQRQHIGLEGQRSFPRTPEQGSPLSRPNVSTRAAAGAAAGSPDEGAVEAGPAAWKMPVYILGWYAFNIIFNIVNKSSLNTFSCPWLVSTWQLAASGLFMVALWALRLQPVPKVDKGFLIALLPVAAFHVIGHVSACLSFSQMAVSFAHIVKSAEPAFSVALSGPLLGQVYPLYVWLSLVPIVAGCAMSAMKEVSFAWNGFNNAMISNLGMVLRNILSKKSLVNYKHVDGINLFGLISIVSLLYCAPAAVYFEGSQWLPAWNAAVEKVGKAKLLQLLALSGVFYHLYNQASYMVLDLGITPVTFSVGNTMKRVVVVVSSVLFFKNPVSAMNWVGSSIAIVGTYLYSVAMDKWSAETKAKKAAEKGK